MNRWIVRLGLAGLLVMLAVYAWTRMNQEDDEDDLEDEIPIEFDVPMETMAAPQAGDTTASTNGRDTGVGPGADLQAPAVESEAAPPEQSTVAAPAPTEHNGDHDHDDLTIIRGIGPVFQQRLFDAGIFTFRQLAEADAAQLDESGIQGVGVDLESWIAQARELVDEHHE
jgi:predicted flap endonuclease-1-like 5' DNA nuclease